MKSNIHTTIGKWLIINILLLCTGCGQTAATPAGPSPTSPLILNISVIEFGSMKNLTDAIIRIGNTLDIDARITERSIPNGMGTSNLIAPAVSLISSSGDKVTDGSCPVVANTSPANTDLYMLDTVSALHAFTDASFADVPSGLADKLTNFSPGQVAFRDGGGILRGIAMGTSPIMIIYNPDKFDKDTFPAQSQNFIGFEDLMNRHTLSIQAYPAIAMAFISNYLGNSFRLSDLATSDFYTITLSDFGKKIDDMRNGGHLIFANPENITSKFMGNNLDWTLGDAMFLRMLKTSNYSGSLAIAPLPMLKFGGAAMGVGWAVPAGSHYTEKAWELVAAMANDPQVIQWILENGMLPFYQAGFDQITKNNALATPWLPQQLFTPENLSVLNTSAAESTAWRVPSEFKADYYNNLILPRSTELMNSVANGSSASAALNDWVKFLSDNSLLNK